MQKKRPAKSSELDSQLAQLEDELARNKDKLNSTETMKWRALQEVEEAKKQLAAMSRRLQESQQQLMELSASEDARVQELRKLSQERDRVWQSEVEAIQKQHCMDSAALASDLNENQKLKRQLEMVGESESTQCRRAEIARSEIESLRAELSETVSTVENLRKQLSDCKGTEAHALQVARETLMQLEEAKKAVEILKSEGLIAKEAYQNLASELQQSKEKANSLESSVRELEEELTNRSKNSLDISREIVQEEDDGDKKYETGETIDMKTEISALKLETDQLKSALEASELRYQEEYIRSTLEIRNAFDQVERAKSESSAREAALEEELKKAKSTIDSLNPELILKESTVEITSTNDEGLKASIEENVTSSNKFDLETELEKLKGVLQDLKAVLLDKETQIQSITEENELLKSEIKKRENERTQANVEATESADTTKAAEREALMKLGHVTEEADKNSRKIARVAEQLDAAQAANTELEGELRRLKVQADQWRKAAEAAAAMISAGGNGKLVDKKISLDYNCNPIVIKLNSPLSDDMDDDSPEKKNGNMLRKIGVLWKKGAK